MIFTRDFVTRENHCRIAPLVTKKSLFTVTHTLFFISTIYTHDYLVFQNILVSPSHKELTHWGLNSDGSSQYTVEPLYNTIVFHQNTHKRHPIARP